MLEVLGTAGHEALVKPKPLRLILPGRHTPNDYAYDPDNGMLACPYAAVRRITPKTNVNSGAACRGLPLRDGCTNPANGRKSASTEHGGLHHAHRAAAKSPDFWCDCRTCRPLVECGVAWLVAGTGRRLRHPGGVKNVARTPGHIKQAPSRVRGPDPAHSLPRPSGPAPMAVKASRNQDIGPRENLPLRRNGWFGCQYTRTSHPNSA